MGLSRGVAPPPGPCQFCGRLELRERDWHGVEQPQKANAADSDPTHQTCLLEAQNFDAQINVLFFLSIITLPFQTLFLSKLPPKT